jgi:hypothetical protein
MKNEFSECQNSVDVTGLVAVMLIPQALKNWVHRVYIGDAWLNMPGAERHRR